MEPFTKTPSVMGHRGAPLSAPENTPEAFAAAAAAGATWVELDVRRSADDVLVVHHDANVADGRAIIEIDAAQLATLGVATFEAVADTLPPGLGADVEVKNLPGQPDFDESDRTALLLAESLSGRLDQRSWMTSSFNPLTVAVLSGALSAVPAGLLHLAGLQVGHSLELAREYGARILCPQVGAPGLDRAVIHAVHEAGFAVVVWTVDDVEEGRRLADAGVDAICTNDPAAMTAALAG